MRFEDKQLDGILKGINSPEDLREKWYDKVNRAKKMKHCTPKGHGLELAFGLGTSSIYLFDMFDITLDGIDINPSLKKIIPYLQEMGGKDYWIGDIQSTGKPDNHYDFINSSSVWEHLEEKEYWNTLKECHRILKPGGRIYVYVDKDASFDHIRVVSIKQTMREMQRAGFTPITPRIYEKS